MVPYSYGDDIGTPPPRPERDTRARRLIILIIICIYQDLYVGMCILHDYFYFHAFAAIYLRAPA